MVTPATDGAILKGITRACAIQLLEDKGHKVVERPVTIDELVLAGQNGTLQEVFGTGTAAVGQFVCLIGYKDTRIELDPDTFTIAPMIKDTINKLRTQEVEDKFHWLEEVI